jgi:murein DD-endopeptidase MepM/ murein hydrolase activator NlpD
MLALCLMVFLMEDIPAPPAPPPEIGLPIEGLAAASLRDSFNDRRPGHKHEAIDIMSPHGTPVQAVVPGTIRKLVRSAAGGITIYQFDETGTHCYFYAHLQRYAKDLREGMRVERGDVIGFVGSTGNATKTAPHLHFSVFEVGPEKKWWTGKVINPYDALVAAARTSSRPSGAVEALPEAPQPDR